jgi:TetR/AcrR family transcriptional repressor of nem operon
MRYPAAETEKKHKRIVTQGARLFRERGFEDVTVGEVMKAAGLTHGAFYNHFDSKEALMTECVESLCSVVDGFVRHFDPSAAGLDAYRQHYLSPTHRDSPGAGCLMAAVGPEASRDPALKASMTTYLRSYFETLTSHFPWSSKRRARSQAIRLYASMVGAIVLARAVDDEDLSKEILAEMRDALST